MNGPRIGIFGVFVLVSTLAACGTDQMMVFRKQGMTVRQQQADEVACIESSIGAVQEPRPSPLPPIDRTHSSSVCERRDTCCSPSSGHVVAVAS